MSRVAEEPVIGSSNQGPPAAIEGNGGNGYMASEGRPGSWMKLGLPQVLSIVVVHSSHASFSLLFSRLSRFLSI